MVCLNKKLFLVFFEQTYIFFVLCFLLNIFFYMVLFSRLLRDSRFRAIGFAASTGWDSCFGWLFLGCFSRRFGVFFAGFSGAF